MDERGDAIRPTHDELALITQLGRLGRMVEAGLSPPESASRLLAEETAGGYTERNRAAMAALGQRLLSPEYMAEFAAAQGETDPAKREAALAALTRANFAAIDMEAVHRTIAARNRQMKAEGLLPPDAPI